MTDHIEFEGWYRALHPRLVASLGFAFGDLDAGSDAADEALVRAFERWDRVSQMGSPDSWTFRVAFNVARRRLRRQAIEQRLIRRHPPEASPAPAGELWHLVAGLPPRQRQAVVLRHIGQLKEPEIAETMGIARGTVSATLRSAYKTLRLDVTEPEPKEHVS